MTELSTLVNPDGMVSSKLVAEKFDRRHGDVLGSIRRVVSEIPDKFAKRHFSFSENTGENGRGDIVEAFLSKDGFALVAMGFTGAPAMRWKVLFLEAFNAMEETIRSELPALRSEVARLKQDNLILTTPKKPHGNKGLVPALQMVDTLFGQEIVMRRVSKDDTRVSDISKLEGKARQMLVVSSGMQKGAINILDLVAVMKRK